MNAGQGQWHATPHLDSQISSSTTESSLGLPEPAGLSTAVLLGVPELNVTNNKNSAVEYGPDIVDLMLDSCFQNTADSQVRAEDELMDDLGSCRSLEYYSAYAEMFKDNFNSRPKGSSQSTGDDSSALDIADVSVPMFGLNTSNEFSLSTGAMHPASMLSSPNIPPLAGNRLGLHPLSYRGRDRGMKRKSKRAPAKPWSKEEHEKFEEALEMFGRNWGECARYIGTRPAPLVRSHAQKYLIKLWKTGKPLPKKVAESGKGYTLSGKPLHPESASAKSYLTKIPCPQNEERKK